MKLDGVRVSEGHLVYVDAGEGPPVLLIHGFPASSLLWRRQVPLLSARMRVIAPDLLGYGDSDRPPDADLSLVGQAGYVRELLAALGVDRAAIVGHGIGGGVAQLLALDGVAEALVLLDSVCFDAWPAEAVRAIAATPAREQTAEAAEGTVRLFLEQGLAHPEQLDPALLEPLVASWRADPGSLFRAAAAIDGTGLAGREGALADLDLPTLVLWGEDDPFLPSEHAERLGELVPGALVALLPGCAHFVAEDAPGTVDRIVYEFLRLRYLGESHGHAPSGPVPVFLRRPSDEELRDLDPEEG